MLSVAGVSEKYIKKWFVLTRKSDFTTRNEAFVEKYVTTIHKFCLFWQKNKRKWFLVPGKCFLKLVHPIGFQQQRKSSEQKDTVSIRQKTSFH